MLLVETAQHDQPMSGVCGHRRAGGQCGKEAARPGRLEERASSGSPDVGTATSC